MRDAGVGSGGGGADERTRGYVVREVDKVALVQLHEQQNENRKGDGNRYGSNCSHS